MNSIQPAKVRAALDAVIAAMRDIGLWNIERPSDDAFDNMGAFGMNTMAFAQWLRWVFIPRVESLLESNGPWPSNSQVSVIAVREGDTDAAVATLVEPLAHFDALFGSD